MQTSFDLSLTRYNSPTDFVWQEQPLHNVFKPKTSQKKKKHPSLPRISQIILVYRMLGIAVIFGVVTL